jgi:hypothetical protein
MENILTDIKTYISIVSFAFAIWQYLKKRRIEALISLEAVELHKNVAQALGAVQTASRAIGTSTSPVYAVGLVEGYIQAILHESAKLYCNLKNTTIDDIDSLVANGQLVDQYKHIYYSFSSGRRGYVRIILKWLQKLY